jgi:signal transduction histidine kinase
MNNRGVEPSAARSELIVREAWSRSRAHGIDPRQVRRQDFDPLRLRRAQERARLLREAAEPALGPVHELMGAEPHMVVLSDPEGFIVRLLEPPAQGDVGRPTNFFEGASWSERDIGTNGVGTALAVGDPVLISGPEHFVGEYQRWTCVGIPLRMPDGTLAGALDFSLPNERMSSHTWGWALSVAAAVEAELARREPLSPVSAELRRLEEWDRRKDEALASLAHELRNPLNVMVMLLDSVDRFESDPARLGALTSRLRHQASRLTRVVGDVGDIARVKRGALLVREEPVELNEVARLALEASVPEFHRRRHRLEVRLCAAPLVVKGDADRLEQILTNLLTNAAKYTPPGGWVTLQSEAAPGQAVVRVRDDGFGIADTDLERIFDEFTRVVPRSGDPGGMGIGLALVRDLVRLHHGTVTARSEGPGRGSEFEVRLPLLALR